MPGIEFLSDPHIWASLVADGLGFHVPRGYIYFAMAFSIMVEICNMLIRRNREQKINTAPTLPKRNPCPTGFAAVLAITKTGPPPPRGRAFQHQSLLRTDF